MILRLLGIPETPLNQFVFLTVAGLTLYFTLSGLSYLIFFVWGKERFHPTYLPDQQANRNAQKWGVIGTIGNVVLMMPFHILIASGHSQIYWDIGEYGWGWLIASFFLYLVFTETCIYWAHRWLHTDRGYHWLHKYHHEWRVTTSWVSMAFHPLDSFLQALPHHLFGFIFPLYGPIYLVMVSFVSVWSVMIHDRVSFVRFKWINYTGHHTLHHWYYDYNYGQFFTFWDRLMGTWKDPEVAEKSGEIPDGVLR
ncbi:sterol desaturase family protein [Sandaracinus amylolyticus]|uniref:Sterol desaturase family protein n=1 Tax=Sandaracinus amylolyticus TaxID=927083 RepID=A0A0F6YJJ5_9BACT|nr:sterol desaturase family protein [Sandaracinus amylolyticus]AKF07388.1 Sterol desaturase family protein [Sandaracinus amylolyticus]